MGFFSRLREDIETARDRDPAARSALEIVLLYPGLHAIWAHRIAHWLFRHRRFLLARLVSEAARFFTGIEIHPGATIGRRFFIDHGMGVVIGETTEIGDDVTIYQGVTLGGTGKEKGKRHPTIRDRVVISADATILGPIEIGENSRVGAGAVVVNSVPPNATVVGVPGRVVKRDGVRISTIDLHHEQLPDPVTEILSSLSHRLDRLSYRLERLEEQVSALVRENTATNTGEPAQDAASDEGPSTSSSRSRGKR
jgi:serine O-acetyltransferase